MVNQTFYITKLELNNFQKHKHLIVNFTKGVNVIVGETDAGKSCVMRAITWLTFPSELKGDVVRRENTKKTSVKAWYNNGIIIERVKSESVNRYIIGEGETKEEYNAIGKTLPKEVQEALMVKHIDIDGDKLILNISNQIALPFLLDKSGSFRMKLFNLMTGNHITDNVMQDYNKDILRLGRQEKSEEDNLGNYNKDLVEAKEVVNDKKEKLKLFKVKYDKIKAKEEVYNNLVEVNDKYKQLESDINIQTLRLQKLKIVPDISDLKTRINKLVLLKEYQLKLGYIEKGILDIKEKGTNVNLPKTNFNEVKEKCDVLEKIKQLKEKQEIKIMDIELKTEQLIIVSRKLKENEQKLKDLKTKIGLCPWCKRKY